MRVMFLVTALLMPNWAGAQTCDGDGGQCDLPEGHYHAAVQDGAKGAVVYLHGYGGRSSAVMRNTRLLDSLSDQGYAVLAVQGMPRFDGDNGGSWNSLQRQGRRDDIAFINSVADDAADRFDIPRDNMILAGFSGGGMMTWVAACSAPDQFASYAPVSGTFWNPLPAKCVAPVRLLHTHGSSDPVVPLEGRSVNSGGLTQGNVFDALEMARQSMGCSEGSEALSADNSDYLRQNWPDCDAGGQLAFDLHDGGHTVTRDWPIRMLAWHATSD